MDSYLILLYVTLEQENGIQALFKQREWLYNRMKFTKTDNKERSDFASPWSRPDSSHNGSMESMMEPSSFSQNSQTNDKRMIKYTCSTQQGGNLECEDQSDTGTSGSDVTNLSQKRFSENQGDEEVVNGEFPFSTSLQKAVYGTQSNEFYEAKVDNSTFHDGESSSKWLQINATGLSSIGTHAQDSFNCDKIKDKNVEEDHDQLSFEIQIKQEEDDLDSFQPEVHADGSFQGISSEQPQLNVAPVMFLNPASIKVANNFLNDSALHVSNHKKKLWRFSKKKRRVSDQNNEDKGTSEIQVSGKTFKRQRKSSSVNQETESGRRKEKCFKKKIKDKATKPYLSDHNKECEKIILDKSHHKKRLLQIPEERKQMELEQNVKGHKTAGNPEKIESDSNKDCENMTLEKSFGSKGNLSLTSEEKTAVGLEYTKTGHTFTENSKNAPTLTESDSTTTCNGKSRVEKGRIFCEDCKESFKLAGKFRRHKRDGKCVFHCEFCGKRYISKDYASFMVHRRYHMDDRPYKCQLCPKAYKFEYQLKVHVRSHAGERPWVCEICGARFLATFNLKQHKLNMHSDETHICDICGASLRNKGYLEWHKKFVHSSERPFPCPTCAQHFKTKKTLKDHQLVHEKALDFMCDICSKGFKTKTRLNYHVRRHQNDRRYQCETCGKRFYCTKTLGNHQMIHSGEKPFKCTVCDYRCTIKSNLGKHMKVHIHK